MSLINDASQGAKGAQKNPPAPGAPLPMRPGEPDQKAGKGPGLVWLIVCGVIVAMGAVFGLNHKSSPASSGNAVPVLARKAPETHPAAARETVSAVNPSIALSNASPANIDASASRAATIRIQAILFSATRPSVMINGGTFFVNDRVGEFQVAAITTNSVTLVNHGETRVLKLAE
jgi:hypothetical protein